VPVPFGKYYLLEKIATGGMAEVFKAKAFGVEGFERLLAVKRILAAIAEDTEFISMFIDEAKIAGRLNHANIVQIFDLGKSDGSYFIAMEYISGQDARAIFERYRRDKDKLGVDLACYTAMKVCEGLDYAHNKADSLGNPLNIVHRDISPQNILVSYEGEVKLCDFGIAKATGKSTQTQVGILKGKFSYMSPEQVRGLTLDRRSDLFSLSICLYELLTCERLFLGESDFETLEKIRKVEVAPPSLYNPAIPSELEDIVLKGLAKDPNQRYQTAAEMQEALQKFLFNQSLHFTNKDLAATMQAVFDEDLSLERQKLEYYQTLDLETIKEQSGEPASKPLRTSVKRGSGSGMAWDDDEIPTTIYDHPDAEAELAAVIADFDEEAGEVWSDGGRDSGSVLPPPPVNSGANRAVRDGRRGDSDAWERIAAAPTDEVKSTPVGLPSTERPQALYAPRPRRGNAVFVSLLVLIALILGAGLAYFLLPRGSQIELSFQPTPAVVEIMLDDQRIHSGPTPTTFRDAEPGTHRVTLWADGYQPMTQDVTLQADRSYVIDWELLPVRRIAGAFRVESQPAGAAIWIDGADTGMTTPSTIDELPLGERDVRLVLAGHVPLEERITLNEEPTLLEPELTVERFQLVIRPTPANARYWLAERAAGSEEVAAGEGPAELPGLDGTKSYILMIEADGHRRYTEFLEPGSEPVRLIEVALVASDEGQPEQPSIDEERERRERERAERERTEREQREDREERERRRREREEREREQNTDDREGGSSGDGGDGGDGNTGPIVVDDDDGQSDEGGDGGSANDEPREPGRLNVQCRPSAEVFVNGRSLGYTPVRNHELPPGRYTVRLVNPQFDLDHTTSVTIEAGEREVVLHQHEN